MLVIYGSDNDPNAKRLVDQAYIRGVPHKHLDPAHWEEFSLQWSYTEASILIDSEPVKPQALYLRHDVFTENSAKRSYLLYASLQSYSFAHSGICLLNRASLKSTNNKSSNLAHAVSLGFQIPETTVVTTNGAVSDLLREDQQAFVAKPLEGGDHTVPVDVLIEPFETYQSVFVQERLPGRNVRLFVIGGVPYAFELKTTDLDYRTDPEVGVVVTTIDDTNRERGVQLAHELGFDYCALDFRENAEGELVFLEINSFPMFVAFDNVCDNALAEAQLRFLCRGWCEYWK